MYRTTIKEWRALLELKDVLPATRGLIMDNGLAVEHPIRSGTVRWVDRENFAWVYNLMQSYAREAQEALGIDRVISIQDKIQLSTYYPGDHYDWHRDARVMSCSVLLSNNFTGGRLEFKEGGPLLKREGHAVFFPDVLHRVRPVLEGTRDSLVVWWK